MRITADRIDPDKLRNELVDAAAGAYVGFEGWIRNHNEGEQVLRLEYEVYEPLALAEGEKVIAEAVEKFPLLHAECVHRSGALDIGECAVWVGATRLLPPVVTSLTRSRFGYQSGKKNITWMGIPAG